MGGGRQILVVIVVVVVLLLLLLFFFIDLIPVFFEEINDFRVIFFLCPLLGRLSFLRVTTKAIAGAREMLRETSPSNEARIAECADVTKSCKTHAFVAFVKQRGSCAFSKYINASTVDTRSTDEIGSERTDCIFIFERNHARDERKKESTLFILVTTRVREDRTNGRAWYEYVRQSSI